MEQFNQKVKLELSAYEFQSLVMMLEDSDAELIQNSTLRLIACAVAYQACKRLNRREVVKIKKNTLKFHLHELVAVYLLISSNYDRFGQYERVLILKIKETIKTV